MNKEQAAAWLPIIQALAEGKQLQLKNAERTTKWVEVGNPTDMGFSSMKRKFIKKDGAWVPTDETRY